jgi:hypothetical protein
MALSALGRKHLLQYGKQREIAEALDEADAFVSNVVNGHARPRTERGWKRYRRVQRAVARRLNLTVEEAFSDRERGVEVQRDEQQSSAA